jgi:ubiquinone/menaquinone biosynthesis C-methylase UbiE
MITRNKFFQAVYDATYGRFVFAGAYDKFLKRSEEAGLSEERRRTVAPAKGRTLEIATGTGLNLPHYPPAVTELVLTEPYPHMLQVLRDKVDKLGRKADVVEAEAEKLPFPADSFDTVVATMILCSAERPEPVLQEIARVLRPGGQYLFLEHVRNPDAKIARKQDLLQPGWFVFGNGCHCNRDTVSTLKKSPLIVEDIYESKIPRAWKIIEAMIIGRATKPLERPANSVPADVRETGMRGALHGTMKEACVGADCEPASAG